MRYLSLLWLLLLCACTSKQDPFIGRWTVERVNVEFDEQIATPEMIRQYGELERGNVIEIAEDSALAFISNGDTLQGNCSIQGTQVLFNGMPFGQYEKGILQTETVAPMGKIKVIYRKVNPQGIEP